MRNIILALLLVFTILDAIAQSGCSIGAGTEVPNVALYDIPSPGDYYIRGTFTGDIRNSQQGVKIIICPTGTWDRPSDQIGGPGSTGSGTIYQNWHLGGDITIENYGTINVLNFSISQAVTLINDGTINIADLGYLDGSNVTNNGSMTFGGKVDIQEGTFTNTGFFSGGTVYIHTSDGYNSGIITSTDVSCTQEEINQNNCGLRFGTKTMPFLNEGTITGNYISFSSSSSYDAANSTGDIEVNDYISCQNTSSSSSFFCKTSSTITVIGCGSQTNENTPGCSALPVVLMNFEVIKKNEQHYAAWMVGSELNFSHYELEISSDGQSFKTLQTIFPDDNSRSLNKMYQSDLFSVVKIGYLRLKMIDKDGSYEYSDIQSVTQQESGIEVFPNPVTQNEINIYIPNDALTFVNVYTQDGRRIFTQKYENQGINNIPLNHEINAMIIVEVINNGKVETKKVMVQK